MKENLVDKYIGIMNKIFALVPVAVMPVTLIFYFTGITETLMSFFVATGSSVITMLAWLIIRGENALKIRRYANMLGLFVLVAVLCSDFPMS